MESGQQEILETRETVEYPPLVKRFQSVIIDQLFIICCMFLFSHLFANADEESTGALKGFLLFGLFLLYEPVSMSFGCTIGNYISGIRVRKFGDEAKTMNIFQSYLRFIVKILLGIISFFTVTSNQSKRTMHDMAAGSIMIYSTKKSTSLE